MYVNESDLNYVNASVSEASANKCESKRFNLRRSMIFAKRRGFERT